MVPFVTKLEQNPPVSCTVSLAGPPPNAVSVELVNAHTPPSSGLLETSCSG